MIALLIFTSAALIVISLTAILNVLIFPRLKAQPPPEDAPLVSVLIPARNEAHVIGQTVRKWLAQTYPNYEVLLLDDASTDGTGDIARDASGGDPRLRVLNGTPLPEGWMGKSWACQQLAQHAQGEILVFTDADVQWQPEALNALIAPMLRHDIDLYTVWPTQHTVTAAERLIVPLMAMVVVGYLPLVMTHHSPFGIFAAANGQCMAWQREAYERVGGHRPVAANVLDDVTLARLAKGGGASLRMADGHHLIACRMYEDWPAVRDGYAKNILAGYGSVPALLLATLFHWLVFLAPWAWLLTPHALWAALLIALGIGVRMLSAVFSHQRAVDALALPVSVLLMTRIAFRALIWHYTGGPRWKGRVIPQTSSQQGASPHG